MPVWELFKPVEPRVEWPQIYYPKMPEQVDPFFRGTLEFLQSTYSQPGIPVHDRLLTAIYMARLFGPWIAPTLAYPMAIPRGQPPIAGILGGAMGLLGMPLQGTLLGNILGVPQTRQTGG